jgi:hypothetical protein
VPAEEHETARGLLGPVSQQVILVAPDRLYEEMMARLPQV